MTPARSPHAILCFSHLRWKFVYQRPQHLLSRAAKIHKVTYIEEPVVLEQGPSYLDITLDPSGVNVVTPFLRHSRDHSALLNELFAGFADDRLLLWYYTPAALSFSRHLDAELIVYDCMDELSAFKFASPELKAQEAELLNRADVVFTGGQCLFEAKRHLHPNVHVFPSSVDAAHFHTARQAVPVDPPEQAPIPHPRLGFFGVIDERLDIELLTEMAEARPDWSFVMIGPVVKIDPQTLPRHSNIHWLGGRDYSDLPRFLAHWDIGFMPFALNDATRFISPTKTPEFLAAGLPVVSSAITDVVRPYGERGLVEIAGTAGEFIQRAELLLRRPREPWLAAVDDFLSGLSWDRTWSEMRDVMGRAIRLQTAPAMARIEISGHSAQPQEGENVGL